MSNRINIKVIMDKTRHHVPKILTTKLIKHRNVKGTRIVRRESLETFNYRKAFYTTIAITLLVGIGIGYGVFATMNIGLSKNEVEANVLREFNNSTNIAEVLGRKEADSLTYILNKDLDYNKVYTFTGAGNNTLEHDVTTNVYHIEDTTPTNVPTTVKRAYSKKDVEANYIKSVNGVEINGLETDIERNPNTYILKRDFNDQNVYAFSGAEIETHQHLVTSNVYHVEDNLPEFVPSGVQRAYSKQDIENNYVKKLDGDMLQGIVTRSEVDPNAYILKSNLDSNSIYSIKHKGGNTTLVDATTSILYKNNDEDINLPTSINTRGYTKNSIENTYIRPVGVKDLQGLTTSSISDPKLYTWDSEFNTDDAYTFSGSIINKKTHIVTNNLYYVEDTKSNLMPINVQRAYSKEDVEKNYVLKSRQVNLNGIDASYERTELSNEHVYSFSGDGIYKPKGFHQITDNVRYSGEARKNNVPNTVTRAYTAKEIETNYVLKSEQLNLKGVSATKEVNQETYIKKDKLKNGYYYQSNGFNNDLEVTKFPITKGQIYQAIQPLKLNDSNLTLQLLDSKEKQHMNLDLEENLYVLNNTKPSLTKLESNDNEKEGVYNIMGEGSTIDLEQTNKEVLTLANKINLFQKEKITSSFDRYGNNNWGWIKGLEEKYDKSWSCFANFSYTDLLKISSKSLPSGSSLTDEEIQHILDNMGTYKLRMFLGSRRAGHNESYEVALNDDGTEWDATNPKVVALSSSKYWIESKTGWKRHKWEMLAGPVDQRIHMVYSDESSNKECETVIRGVQVYTDSL